MPADLQAVHRGRVPVEGKKKNKNIESEEKKRRKKFRLHESRAGVRRLQSDTSPGVLVRFNQPRSVRHIARGIQHFVYRGPAQCGRVRAEKR